MSIFSSILLAAAIEFSSPVDIPITLAGNFGEPRPNHFHGGIDIRTEGQMGLPIFSVADGYVSRILIGTGYGNTVYVTHPNGLTTLYAHLNGLAAPLRRLVSKERIRRGEADEIDRPHYASARLDIHLKPMVYPVSQGQLIAWSGNTGASMGPHLHLEFQDTKTKDIHDPLLYLSKFLIDKTPPVLNSIMAYPQSGEGIFEHSTENQLFMLRNNSDGVLTAWGRVGFGVCADDFMEGANNHYGIRRTELFVDDSLVFWSDVNMVSPSQNRMVNAWGDYAFWLAHKQWYMKSFIEPGNALSIVHADANRGVVNFNEEKPYQLKYVLTDAFGNSSSYDFTIQGKRDTIPCLPRKNTLFTMKWNQTNAFQLPGLQLDVPRWRLADDVELKPQVQFVEGGVSDIYVFTDRACPLFSWSRLSIRVKHASDNYERLHIFCDDRDLGGVYQDGWVVTNVRELEGQFYVGYVKEDM